MHCHPALKPFSWSIKNSKNPLKQSSERTSLWYRDPPKTFDRLLNKLCGLTKFTQSDFTNLTNGNVKIISACLNPIERGLFTDRWSLKRIVPGLIRFILELNIEYIKNVRKENRNYFVELDDEYKFYISEEIKQDPTSKNQFKLTRNFSDIENNLNDPDKNIISVFFSIEGCHVFNNCGLAIGFQQNNVLENIETVKKWDHPPLYVSIAHHINNDICGHAKSLPSFIGRIIDQKSGMEDGFSEFGEKVLHKLLEEDPRRIYIDIKHMSIKSRIRYYGILDSEKYKDEPIPVIVSHGAVNGRKLIIPWKEVEFNTENINIFDDEIIRIHRSGGFLGIQLDERRLCPLTEERSERWRSSRAKRLKLHSKFVWNQIHYVAKVLDDEGLFGWGTATIGSDYDGIVDTLNGFWTSEDFGILEENLINHADTYFEKHFDLTLKENREITPQQVIDLFMCGNAQRFLENFY